MQAQQELLQEGEVKCLGCLGATPFSVWCIFGTLEFMMSIASDGSFAILRIFRILELIGLGTSSLGIYYLRRRSQNQQKIPRNICCCFSCCCNCPFLPWSLVVSSALDILGILLAMILGFLEDENETLAFVFAFIQVIACILDGTFGIIWFRALNKQDPTEGICCSNNHVQNMAPMQNPVDSTIVTVVGQPIQATVLPDTQMAAQGAPVEKKV